MTALRQRPRMSATQNPMRDLDPRASNRRPQHAGGEAGPSTRGRAAAGASTPCPGPRNQSPITSNTYKVVESSARVSRLAVGHVASVGRSPASIHLIMTSDAARALMMTLSSMARRPESLQLWNGFDPQMWAGIALDLEVAADLGDLGSATGPADLDTPPALLPHQPRHRDDGQVATVLAWTRYPNGYEPRHAKTANEIGANR